MYLYNFLDISKSTLLKKKEHVPYSANTSRISSSGFVRRASTHVGQSPTKSTYSFVCSAVSRLVPREPKPYLPLDPYLHRALDPQVRRRPCQGCSRTRTAEMAGHCSSNIPSSSILLSRSRPCPSLFAIYSSAKHHHPIRKATGCSPLCSSSSSLTLPATDGSREKEDEECSAACPRERCPMPTFHGYDSKFMYRGSGVGYLRRPPLPRTGLQVSFPSSHLNRSLLLVLS
jgi:hypothetical protein